MRFQEMRVRCLRSEYALIGKGSGRQMNDLVIANHYAARSTG